MMFWIIGFLTLVLVLDCLFLILLILVQLPKKEAGLGQAFGSGATDALFGAGSGNALTNMTKYAAVFFFVLTLSLSVLNAQQAKSKRSTLEQTLQQTANEVAPGAAATTAEKPAAKPAAPLTTTPGGLLSATNAPAAPAKPAPAPAAPATPAPVPGGAK